MAPCFSVTAASIRQASITMSWVAEMNPTSTAKSAMRPRLRTGSVPAISQRPSRMSSWQSNIQERRWPSHLVTSGTVARSTSGAQRNFSE